MTEEEETQNQQHGVFGVQRGSSVTQAGALKRKNK